MAKIFPDKWKEYAELKYWKKRKEKERELTNKHYQYFYTTHFDLRDVDCKKRRILDIGCGHAAAWSGPKWQRRESVWIP